MAQEPGCNILGGFSPDMRKDFRKLVVDMVMATDMVKHTKFMSDFTVFVEQIHGRVRLLEDDSRYDCPFTFSHPISFASARSTGPRSG